MTFAKFTQQHLLGRCLWQTQTIQSYSRHTKYYTEDVWVYE